MWGGVIAKLAGTLVAALLVILIYLAGVQSGLNKAGLACQKEKVVAIERAIEQANQIAKENAEVAFEHVQVIERIKTEYKYIAANTDKHLAEHPALDRCDIGTDGLRLWNKANTSATAPGR